MARTIEIHIPLSSALLSGELTIPRDARSIIIFSHGSGSSRFSRRNRFVAAVMQEHGFATLLFDLLTEEEDRVYERRFDIALLSERLIGVTEWLAAQKMTEDLKPAYFGASTGAASALNAAAVLGSRIKAVVSRGGRPDLANELVNVKAPVLLIVGGEDIPVIEMNRTAFEHLKGVKEMIVVPGATHLFEEPGKMEEVARLAAAWFGKFLERKKTGRLAAGLK